MELDIIGVGFAALEIFRMAIIATLSVLTLKGIKAVIPFIDNLSPTPQQFASVAITNVLMWVSTVLAIALPPDLELFTTSTTEGMIAAALALAIHAGKKAKENAG